MGTLLGQRSKRSADGNATPRVAAQAERRGQAIGYGLSFNRETVAVSIDNGEARVLMVRGGEVVGWGVVSLDGKDDVERASTLSGLLADLKVRRARVLVALPLYATLVRRMSLPRLPQRHLEAVVFSELGDSIPFSRNEVDVVWLARRRTAGREVLATAVPRAIVDEQAGLLKKSGLKPSAAYPAGVALARAMGVSDGIVAQLLGGTLTTVLVREDVPRIVARVPFPLGEDTPDGREEAVTSAVEGVVAAGEPLEPSREGVALPLVLAGRLATDEKLAQALHAKLGMDVLRSRSVLKYPEHFPAGEYAVNLGLVLADRLRGKAVGETCWPIVNMLPERHRARRLPIKRAAFLVGVALLAIAGVNAMGRVTAVEAEGLVLAQRLAALQERERQVRLEAARIAAAERASRDAAELATNVEADLVGLAGEMDALLARLNALNDEARALKMRLSTITVTGSGFVVAGTANTYEDALRYTTALRASGRFTDVALTRAETSRAGVAGTGEDQVSFQMKAGVSASGETWGAVQR